MSLLLYGVVEVVAVASLGTGVDDRPLRPVADGPLMAIVTDHDDAGPLARPELARSIRRALPQRDLPVLDAYLVDRARVGEFVALVAELADLLDGVELVCTGPCPPYSFADGGVIRSTS